MTTEGRREFYFYAKNPPLTDSLISGAMASFPEYKFKWGAEEDPQWEHYSEFLYPSEEEFQWIQNEYVVENLEKHGDSLEKRRDVEHWSYFPTARARDAFKAAAEMLGFSTSDAQRGDGEFPFGACISRCDRVDRNSTGGKHK
jgi:hypothetical protein